jgi:DNA-binding HxlR family transcriptional regulator
MRWSELHREPCSMARTISVIGDRWTLMILRDCFLRIRRFEDFERSLGITRHLLADRLRKLVKAGVLRKQAYNERPKRYEYRLTDKGLDLYPVMMAVVHWGDTHMAGSKGRPLLHEHIACGHTFDPVMSCSHCQAAVDARAVRVRPGPGGRRPI